MRFPIMGYDCGHGVLEGDCEIERKWKMIMVKSGMKK